jgi:hypothetical protein
MIQLEGRQQGKTEALRQEVCKQFAQGNLAFADAFYSLTTIYGLTQRMAAAYLGSARISFVARATVTHRCTAHISQDGGSGGPLVPCDGHRNGMGEFVGGCGEPCRWRMQKGGEGEPPWA